MIDLISTPDPGGEHGEPKQQPRPGQVPGDRVPQQVEGIGARLVTAGVSHADVSHRRGVAAHQALVPAHF